MRARRPRSQGISQTRSSASDSVARDEEDKAQASGTDQTHCRDECPDGLSFPASPLRFNPPLFCLSGLTLRPPTLLLLLGCHEIGHCSGSKCHSDGAEYSGTSDRKDRSSHSCQPRQTA
jgi:hypothetical protein